MPCLRLRRWSRCHPSRAPRPLVLLALYCIDPVAGPVGVLSNPFGTPGVGYDAIMPPPASALGAWPAAAPAPSPSAGIPGLDYASVFKTGCVPQVISDLNGRFIDCNDAFCQLTGCVVSLCAV